MTQATKDPHGNLQLGGGALGDFLTKLVKDRLGISRVRTDTFGYLQRSFAGIVSDVDQREAREVGEKAVQYAMSGARTAAQSPSIAPATMRWTTSCRRLRTWRP